MRVTKHERHLTLGNEGEVGGGLGWLCDGHWGGNLAGWALGVMLYVGKLNSNKKLKKQIYIYYLIVGKESLQYINDK